MKKKIARTDVIACILETPPSADVYLRMSEKEKNLETQRAIDRLRRIVLAIRYQVDTDTRKSNE